MFAGYRLGGCTLLARKAAMIEKLPISPNMIRTLPLMIGSIFCSRKRFISVGKPINSSMTQIFSIVDAKRVEQISRDGKQTSSDGK